MLHPLRLKDTFKKKDRDHVLSKVAQTAEQLPLTLNTLCYAQHFRSSIKRARRHEGSCNFSKNSSNLRPHAVIDIFSHPEHTVGKTIVDDIPILASPRYFVAIFNTVITADLTRLFLCYIIFCTYSTHYCTEYTDSCKKQLKHFSLVRLSIIFMIFKRLKINNNKFWSCKIKLQKC